MAQFPMMRMRRNRYSAWSRDLVSEHSLSVKDLIYPVFLTEGRDQSEAVPSMPGVSRVSLDQVVASA